VAFPNFAPLLQGSSFSWRPCGGVLKVIIQTNFSAHASLSFAIACVTCPSLPALCWT